ncbi:MAG TPA: EthD family reductase, partial [Longimicrobiales bacterium]
KGPVISPTGGTYHRVGTLRFDSMDDLQKAVVSPEGQAAAADVMTFAAGGVTMLFFDTIDI